MLRMTLPKLHLLVGLIAVMLFASAGWILLGPTPVPPEVPVSPTTLPEAGAAGPRSLDPAQRPWRYGHTDARFTLIGYADLECPYCRAYFPVLKRWVDAHPEVVWRWHHLPLSGHEPAATAGARLVECVGEAEGQDGFWQAVEWVYGHTQGGGQGVPEGLRYPHLTTALQDCLSSGRVDEGIRAQAEEAIREGVTATPALRLRDNQTGRTLLLHGPVEGDALLSALDLLVSQSEAGSQPAAQNMSADPVGVMPR